MDLYAPHSRVANTLFALVNAYEHFTPNFIRRRALKAVYRQVVMEDENTAYQVSSSPHARALRRRSS